MKLGFAILAHEKADELTALIDTLVSCDCLVSLHYDANASDTDFALLTQRYARSPAVFFAKREACGWGEFSLVRATLNCLEAFDKTANDLDYVYLISGADIPIKPISALKLFLAECYANNTEFLEYHPLDEGRWVQGGLEAERFLYRFFINERRHPIWFTLSWKVQQLARLRVRPPRGLRLALGSQWWCLTWKTCQDVLAYIKQRPDVYSFFRLTWIPDESFFQTIVGSLVPRNRIRNHSLTFYQFSDYCKPYVFFVEHRAFLGRLTYFFARKIAHSAVSLRRELLDIARKPDSFLISSSSIGERTSELDVLRESRRLPQKTTRAIGRFYESRFSDLPFSNKLIFVCIVPCAFVSRAHLANVSPRHSRLVLHGHLFARDHIEFAGNCNIYGGYARTDKDIRDLHPAAFLANISGAGPSVTTFLATCEEFRRHLTPLIELPNFFAATVLGDKFPTLLAGKLLRHGALTDAAWQPDSFLLEAHASDLRRQMDQLQDLPRDAPALANIVPLCERYRVKQEIVRRNASFDKIAGPSLDLIDTWLCDAYRDLQSTNMYTYVQTWLRSQEHS